MNEKPCLICARGCTKGTWIPILIDDKQAAYVNTFTGQIVIPEKEQEVAAN